MDANVDGDGDDDVVGDDVIYLFRWRRRTTIGMTRIMLLRTLTTMVKTIKKVMIDNGDGQQDRCYYV